MGAQANQKAGHPVLMRVSPSFLITRNMTSLVAAGLKPQAVNVAILSRDGCQVVKCLSSCVIAGSLRNICQYTQDSKALPRTIKPWRGLLKRRYPFKAISEQQSFMVLSQTHRDKVMSREGKSPQRKTRSPTTALVIEKVKRL